MTTKHSYESVLERTIKEDKAMPRPQYLSLDDCHRGIEQCTRALRGPLGNGERIILVAERESLRTWIRQIEAAHFGLTVK